MNRRILAIILMVLGLGTLGGAIASATVWKPPEVVTVPLPQTPEVNYVISAPGVLNIVNETVTVRAHAPEETPVFLGVGRTNDVEAWVAASDHGRIVGLETWDHLSYETVEAQAVPLAAPDVEEDEEEPVVNPAGSDMWVEEVNGIGELSYTWEEIPGRWSIIVATDGTSPAPMVEFTWEREVPTPLLVPGTVAGALILAAGALLLVIDLARRRRAPAPDGDPARAEGSEPAEESAAGEEPAGDSPEEIMAGVEAMARAGEAEGSAASPYPATFLPAPDADYPHHEAGDDDEQARDNEQARDDDAPEAEAPGRPLTRREIRERERRRERAEALADGGGEAEWPTQAEEPTRPEGGRRRRWWQRRKPAPEPVARGPIIIDDDTGEIIVTGEIDVSNITPQASASTWRATWGLDKDTPARWIPVVKQEGDEDEE